jgi:Xaa-Pro dipeptidase
MEVVDATDLAERLRWEDNEYWLHFEVESPLDKYPGKYRRVGRARFKLMVRS